MARLIAGIDVGNSTTEAAIAEIDGSFAPPRFLSSSRVPTTGIKGTLGNIPGIVHALREALEPAGLAMRDLDLVLLNEATPVIGDIAMETITETIITESTMIGHNPNSPAASASASARPSTFATFRAPTATGRSWSSSPVRLTSRRPRWSSAAPWSAV